MTDLGWYYPAGAANDPSAPCNESIMQDRAERAAEDAAYYDDLRY